MSKATDGQREYPCSVCVLLLFPVGWDESPCLHALVVSANVTLLTLFLYLPGAKAVLAIPQGSEQLLNTGSVAETT